MPLCKRTVFWLLQQPGLSLQTQITAGRFLLDWHIFDEGVWGNYVSRAFQTRNTPKHMDIWGKEQPVTERLFWILQVVYFQLSVVAPREICTVHIFHNMVLKSYIAQKQTIYTVVIYHALQIPYLYKIFNQQVAVFSWTSTTDYRDGLWYLLLLSPSKVRSFLLHSFQPCTMCP